MNLSDLTEMYDFYSWSPIVPDSSTQQMEEVVKELKLLRNFVYFVSDRCTDLQSQQTFFTHVLVVAGHAAMVSWLNLPNDRSEEGLVSARMNASFSDLRMRIQPIQPCIHKIYIDVLQALKSGCHQNIQAEYVADYKASFVETLVHHLEVLPITDKHKKMVAFKDRNTMLNFLRANLINLPRETLEDFDTALINVGLLVYSSFSGDIQSMKALIYFLTRKSFQTNLPKIDGLGSIDIILDDLKELLNCYSDSLSSMRSQLWTIQQQLEHFQKKHDGVGSFAMQVISKAYEVNHLVVGCINKDIPEWCLVLWIGDIIEEIKLIVREVAEIHENKVSDLVLHNTTDVATPHTLQFERITSMSEEMVGFDEVMNKLRRQLIRGSSNLDVISIVGMAGLAYTRKDLFRTILRGVKKDAVISDELPANELADKLRKLLLIQRYLILVDDIWETIGWDDLKPCFCDSNNGSRIILTTRLGDVASHAKLVSDPHFLRLFTPEESWMLLKNKVFNKKSCPLVLEDVGKTIARKCGGLPLSIVLVAGILETTEKEKHSWEQVAISLGSHIQAKSEDIINLSYQDLPFHLKPCFLYFGVFLEDEEIQVSKLTWLWMAEGLVKTHKEKLSEDIAEYYLKNLIGRNLVMVSKKSSDGDNLAEWRSICFDVQSFHLMKGRQIAVSSIGRASYTFNSFKYLRVLDLEFTVIDSFPKTLTCLRYVAIRVSDDSSLSFSDNLWNLETLIVKGLGGRVTVPGTLWKMVKLRHLHIYNRVVFNINNALREMDRLKTLSSVWFSCVEDTNRVFAKITNLQKLRCEILTCDAFFPAFNSLTKLEMLKFSWGRAGTWATKLNLPPKWDVSDDAFPCLEHLVLIRWRHLEVIPSRFADMPTLKSIEVMACKQSLVESAKDIWETQVDEMQNSDFKLFIKGILLSNTDSFSLAAYSKSDWAAYANSHRSVTGFYITLGDSPISSKSKKQPAISLSYAEAEYRALHKVVAELCCYVQGLG
ncbi:hypothetical protein CQW23_25522 [Capsicum baccatum]|uniref:Uncharacterized protein n=1 Tax=Capsicum baccatum TaxID=33114 RepID=A0A2G2VL77_CAPBA|nr:hypothetical protein CQW23_25522 [Capsicum baccatum]